MTENTFMYLWEEGIKKATNNILKKIPGDIVKKYDIKPNLDKNMYEKVYKEYHQYRNRVRKNYFDVGQNDENLMDGHKICSCITGALLDCHIFSFVMGDEDMPKYVAYLNYEVAFLSGIYIQYLFLLSDLLKENDVQSFEKLKKRATFVFPETNIGHDSYVCGRIKTLAINDIYGIDFDVLTYADMLFWIEDYNKRALK